MSKNKAKTPRAKLKNKNPSINPPLAGKGAPDNEEIQVTEPFTEEESQGVFFF